MENDKERSVKHGQTFLQNKLYSAIPCNDICLGPIPRKLNNSWLADDLFHLSVDAKKQKYEKTVPTMGRTA